MPPRILRRALVYQASVQTGVDYDGCLSSTTGVLTQRHRLLVCSGSSGNLLRG